MFSSIRERLWLSYAALIVAALMIVATVLTVFLLRNPYVYRQTAVRLKAAEALLLRDPQATGRRALIAEALEVRILVLSPEGELLSDSGGNQATLARPPLDRRVRSSAAVRDAEGNVWLYTRARLQDGTWLVVAARRPGLLPALSLLRDELWRPLIQAGIIALALALILAYALARWIAAPLQNLAAAARAVGTRVAGTSTARGREADLKLAADESTRLADRGPLEVRELSRAFKAMLESVAVSQRSQREFVANVSHELKTPLTSIQGFSQAILDGTAEGSEAQRQAAQIIHDEAGRMHRMALDLLDLARLDAGTADLKTAPVDLRMLLEGVVERFRPRATDSGVTLDLSATDSPLVVRGDGDRLAQIFSNLVDNALRFTQKGGRVNVRADVEQAGIRVAVTDTGTGIAEADLPHIFDRFYQADAARGGGSGHGAGLGLAIAREMVEAHGGRITVRSALGKGAEFEVHLPPLEGSRVGGGTA